MFIKNRFVLRKLILGILGFIILVAIFIFSKKYIFNAPPIEIKPNKKISRYLKKQDELKKELEIIKKFFEAELQEKFSELKAEDFNTRPEEGIKAFQQLWQKYKLFNQNVLLEKQVKIEIELLELAKNSKQLTFSENSLDNIKIFEKFILDNNERLTTYDKLRVGIDKYKDLWNRYDGEAKVKFQKMWNSNSSKNLKILEELREKEYLKRYAKLTKQIQIEIQRLRIHQDFEKLSFNKSFPENLETIKKFLQKTNQQLDNNKDVEQEYPQFKKNYDAKIKGKFDEIYFKIFATFFATLANKPEEFKDLKQKSKSLWASIDNNKFKKYNTFEEYNAVIKEYYRKTQNLNSSRILHEYNGLLGYYKDAVKNIRYSENNKIMNNDKDKLHKQHVDLLKNKNKKTKAKAESEYHKARDVLYKEIGQNKKDYNALEKDDKKIEDSHKEINKKFEEVHQEVFNDYFSNFNKKLEVLGEFQKNNRDLLGKFKNLNEQVKTRYQDLWQYHDEAMERQLKKILKKSNTIEILDEYFKVVHSNFKNNPNSTVYENLRSKFEKDIKIKFQSPPKYTNEQKNNFSPGEIRVVIKNPNEKPISKIFKKAGKNKSIIGLAFDYAAKQKKDGVVTIYIGEGDYVVERVMIGERKNWTIYGQGSKKTTIKPKKQKEDKKYFLVIYDSKNIKIEGIKFASSGKALEVGNSDLIMENCALYGDIRIQKAKGKIRACYFMLHSELKIRVSSPSFKYNWLSYKNKYFTQIIIPGFKMKHNLIYAKNFEKNSQNSQEELQKNNFLLTKE